jgi:hypothetical protein
MFEEMSDWTADETASLRALWEASPAGEKRIERCRRLAPLFGRTIIALREKAVRLGLADATSTVNSYMLPPKPLYVPWEPGELLALPLLYAAAAGQPHWVRCQQVGKALGRSALGVHLAWCRINGQRP